jgi:hypothetical protein
MAWRPVLETIFLDTSSGVIPGALRATMNDI